MLPTVDVLMLVYNHERTLKKSIQSVLDQKNVNINLIITNDASTDNSKFIIDSFKNDNIICYHKQENEGVATNAEFLLDLVRAEFVAFLEGDDQWISDTKLSDQIDALGNNFSFCYTQYLKYNHSQNIQTLYSYKDEIIEGKDLIIDVINNKLHCFHINTLLLKSEVLIEVRNKYYQLFYDKNISAGDLRLFCTLANNYKGYFLNQKTMLYNFDQGVSADKKNIKWRVLSIYSKFKISLVIFGINKQSLIRFIKLILFCIKIPFLTFYYFIQKN